MSTSAPQRASWIAVARPIPVDPPLITARLPANNVDDSPKIDSDIFSPSASPARVPLGIASNARAATAGDDHRPREPRAGMCLAVGCGQQEKGAKPWRRYKTS